MTKKRNKSQEKKKRLRKEADNLWKKAVIKKYGSTCEVCESEPTETGHHFFTKNLYGHLRYVIENGIAIGRKCHFNHHHRGDPIIHATIIEKRGKRWYNKLKNMSRENPSSYQIIKYYENQIQKLTKHKNA